MTQRGKCDRNAKMPGGREGTDNALIAAEPETGLNGGQS